MNIRVAIIDNNAFLLQSVSEKLTFFENITITFTATNGADGLRQLAAAPATELILMDIEMPGMNGVETTRLIKQSFPDSKVIILTVFDDDETIFQAIQAGADGYLLKDTAPQALHDAMLQTLQGGAVMTPSIALKTLNLLRPPQLPTARPEEAVVLSGRETAVLEQLSKGLPYTTIALNLFISPHTVRRHIENIYQKLQVHSKIEAIEMARRNKMIE